MPKIGSILHIRELVLLSWGKELVIVVISLIGL